MRGDIVTTQDVEKLADMLKARAEEYRKPYDEHDELTDFYSSRGAPTYTALLDVSRILREWIAEET